MKKFACSALALAVCCCSLNMTGCSTETAPVKPTTFGNKPSAEATPGKKQSMSSSSNVDTSVAPAD